MSPSYKMRYYQIYIKARYNEFEQFNMCLKVFDRRKMTNYDSQSMIEINR